MNKIKLIFILLIVFLLYNYCQLTFASIYLPKYDFNILIPNFWEITPTTNNIIALELENKTSSANLTIYYFPDISDLKIIKEQIQNKNWQKVKERKLSETELKNSGANYGIAVLQNSLIPNNNKFKFDYFYKYNNQIYVISLICGKKQWKNIEKDIRLILKNFWFGASIRDEQALLDQETEWRMVGKNSKNYNSLTISPINNLELNNNLTIVIPDNISASYNNLTFYENTIYLKTDYKIIAYKLNGEIVWEHHNQNKILKNILLETNLLFFLTFKNKNQLVLNSLKSSTGEIYFQKDIKGKDTTYLVSNDNIIYLVIDKKLTAIENESGSIIWQTTANYNNSFYPVISNDYITAIKQKQNLVVADKITGEKIWEKKLEGFPLFSPIITNNLVLVFYKSNIHQVFNLKAYNLETGKEIWNFPKILSLKKVLNRPSIINNQLVFLGIDKNKTQDLLLFVVNTENGEEIKQYKLNKNNWLLDNIMNTNEGIFILSNNINKPLALNRINFSKGTLKKYYLKETNQILDTKIFLNQLFLINNNHELQIYY